MTRRMNFARIVVAKERKKEKKRYTYRRGCDFVNEPERRMGKLAREVVG